MQEQFLHVFYDEDEGIDARFRDEDYYLDEQDVMVVTSWIDQLITKIRAKKSNPNDIQDLVRVIETLNKSPEESASDLLSTIYFKFNNI